MYSDIIITSFYLDKIFIIQPLIFWLSLLVVNSISLTWKVVCRDIYSIILIWYNMCASVLSYIWICKWINILSNSPAIDWNVPWTRDIRDMPQYPIGFDLAAGVRDTCFTWNASDLDLQVNEQRKSMIERQNIVGFEKA